MKLKTDFENLNEAPEVGAFSTTGGTTKVYVYSEEGTIPHVHLVGAVLIPAFG